MTVWRAVAALAAVLTALLVQATLIAPLTNSVPVSLPAVLVGAVAIYSTPATGMTLGFTTGLLADLGSEHPAGVLALAWLVLGFLLGRIADAYRDLRACTAVVSVAAAISTLFAGLATSILHRHGVGHGVEDLMLPLRVFVFALLGDALLALLVVPLVRVSLRTNVLRLRRPPLPSWRPEPPVIRRG